MSSAIVTPDDLGVYLNLPTINQTRASSFIDWAQALCESVVTPLPTGAEPIVLDVAARGFSNPTNVTQQAVLNSSASYGAVRGGMWLTNANKSALRRLAGMTGVFEVDMTQTVIQGPPPSWTFADFDEQP
jgi:hypothetical protein